MCLHMNLNVAEIDYFKFLMDGWLVDMEEARTKAQHTKDSVGNDEAEVVQDEEQPDV